MTYSITPALRRATILSRAPVPVVDRSLDDLAIMLFFNRLNGYRNIKWSAPFVEIKLCLRYSQVRLFASHMEGDCGQIAL